MDGPHTNQHDEIYLFAVEGTEDSDVIVYETIEQRTLRFVNECGIKQRQEELNRLMEKIAHLQEPYT